MAGELVAGELVAGELVAGDLVRLEIGAVAHGGHCVARYEGRVVFVRHTLPGEQVVARLTEAAAQARFWRAEAVEVLRASPDRVPPPCPWSGPSRPGAGGCGGCDWQHVSLPAQRRLKAQVVAEQLTRLGGVELAGVELAGVEPAGAEPAGAEPAGAEPAGAGPDAVAGPAGPGHVLGPVQVRQIPGDDDGLGWRTRMRFGVDGGGRAGLRRHRGHGLVPVRHCPIAHPGVAELQIGERRWPGLTGVEVTVGGVGVSGAPGGAGTVAPGQRLVILEPARPAGDRGGHRRGRRGPSLSVPASLAERGADGLQRLGGHLWVQESVLVDGVRRSFRVTGGGFWQVHPGAAQTLLDAVLELTDPRPGESAVDLYCGVGLFAAGLALRVGAGGRVLGVEGDPRAAADARRSLHDLPLIRLEAGGVEPVLRRVVADGRWARADVVVLDPPRSGAGRRVMEAVAALRPRVVAYVSCDPAALARDIATAARLGYRPDRVEAFDTFPMTHHVECVARLIREGRT